MEAKRKAKAKHGGHDPDKVLLGLHVTPQQKAVAKLTAIKMGCDVTTIMLMGLWEKAARFGITDLHGKVTPAYAQDIELIEEQVRTNKATRQGNGN